MQGAGNLSFNNISESEVTKLLTTVVELFGKALETEIQEKVLTHTLDMFSLWSFKFDGDLPKKVMEIFKKGLTLKSTTQSVRVAYLQWLLACLNKGKLGGDVDLTPLLLQTVEKASQNSTQLPLVSEAICAVCLILITEVSSESNNQKLNSFWNIVLDMNKQVFVSERYITSAPSDSLCYVTLMAEKLLTQHYGKLKGTADPLYKAIVYSITSASAKVRDYSLKVVSNILRHKDGVKFAKCLLLELRLYIETAKIVYEGETQGSDSENAIPNHAFIDAIEQLCSFDDISNADAQILALNSLLCSHHTAIVSSDNEFWETLLKYTLQLEPKSFISLNIKQIKELLIEEYKPNKMYENALATIVRLSPEMIIPIIINKVTVDLNNPEMSNVTDDEYFTYLTPDGELYDKSVIPNSEDIYQTAGMKRENKTYSYKEQLEELQLRREIEEKRRKEGKAKPPQLTPKQQEAIKNQTEKEKAIKNRLKSLNDKLVSLVSIMEAVCIGNPKQISLQFHQLLPSILGVLQSPLAAQALTNLYFHLRSTVFSSDLGNQLAITTLRLSKPHCDLKAEWTAKPLDDQIVETLQKLYSETVGKMEEVNDVDADEDDLNKNFYLTAPAFCYAFEFIRKAFESQIIRSSDDYLSLIVTIIEKHAQIKGESKDGTYFDFTHPKYMPRLEMLRLLLDLILRHRGRVQTQAVAAVLDVAGSSSGESNCATASDEEIELCLYALQSHLEVIRDVTLRAMKIMVLSFEGGLFLFI